MKRAVLVAAITLCSASAGASSNFSINVQTRSGGFAYSQHGRHQFTNVQVYERSHHRSHYQDHRVGAWEVAVARHNAEMAIYAPVPIYAQQPQVTVQHVPSYVHPVPLYQTVPAGPKAGKYLFPESYNTIYCIQNVEMVCNYSGNFCIPC
jgi:hypothetical protein